MIIKGFMEYSWEIIIRKILIKKTYGLVLKILRENKNKSNNNKFRVKRLGCEL